MAPITTQRRTELVFVIFFFSGLAGLIYESVWSHYVKLFLGHAAYAQTLVLVVFIGGLALGSWLCARVAERIRNPLRLYALVEAAIGLMALAFHAVFVSAVDWGYASLLPATCEQASTFCAGQWTLSALLLAPQSILLGATFPLVSSAVLRMSAEHPGHDIASLYFLNSLGAVMGVMASAFVLIPAIGLPGTLKVAGCANLAIALVAFTLSKTPAAPLVVQPVAACSGATGLDDRRLIRLLLVVAMLTGLSSFIYEIVWIRMLSLVLGASTHSFELMLASFILGLALGGLWVRNRVDLATDTVRFLAIVQLCMGVLAMATLPFYNAAFDFMAWLLSALSRNDAGFVLFNLASTLISLVVMLPATFCAGMTLPLITYRLLRSPAGERSLGTVYAVNTLGSIAGVIVAVHLLLTHLGTGHTLLVGAAIDVVLGVVLLMPRRRATTARMVPWPAAVAVLMLLVLAVAFPVDATRGASGVFRTGVARIGGAELVWHRDGKTATVDVVSSPEFRSIRTNGKTDASMAVQPGRKLADEYTMALLAALPLVHKPDARTAAVIGFGSGASTTLLLASDKLERVDTIEIEPAMVEGAQHFRPFVDAAFTDPRSHIVIDDAKSYFARGHGKYDIVVSEPSNPWVSGVSSLFTEEFYKRLSLYMNDGAVLSQWLHIYEMDAPTFASIIAALEKTFPDFVMYTPIDGDVVVIARKNGMPGALYPRVLALPKLQPTLAKLGLTDVEAVRRLSVGSSATLRPFFATYGAPPNSDYFPLVDHRASKTRFTKVRVQDFAELQGSSVPILEMLDGNFMPDSQPRVGSGMSATGMLSMNAWSMYEGLVGGLPREAASAIRGDQDAGRMVRLWAGGCGAEWGFPQVLPTMVHVAETLSPQLQSGYASKAWNAVGSSRCGRELPAEDHHWVQLFEAVAARDAARMASLGEALLETTPGPSAASEYAFLATVTGLICKGESAHANEVMDRTVGRALRRGEKATQLRYLVSVSRDPAAAAAAARCR